MPGQSPRDLGQTSLGAKVKSVAIIGGGPAGLRAAEIAAAAGAAVIVYDAKASVGRKLLVAGKGGLNLTKAEELEKFLASYGGPDLPRERWNAMIRDFDPEALRAWAAELGVETFAASTGRVYPREMKGAPLLRRWVQRLKSQEVHFAMHHRWIGLHRQDRWQLNFATREGTISHEADAVVLALGGKSWPETGSDGEWVAALKAAGIAVTPWQPANCGWEADWPENLTAEAEGQPVKNITARAGDSEAVGELLITRHGLEGGAIYQLSPALRAMPEPILTVDFKPGVSCEQLVRKLGIIRRNFLSEAKLRWKIGDGAFALISRLASPEPIDSAESLARVVKAFPIRLTGPRPIDEAISSAGGVAWSELDDGLMLRKLPGIFCAGEMIDWEAPTGGYLMQGCFASGTLAGRGAGGWVGHKPQD